MRRRFWGGTWAAVWSLGLACLSAPAVAVLGEPVASVHADQMRWQGTRRVSSTLQYQRHTIQSPGGVVVRQYAAATGPVFCVSWRSPVRPKLESLLGQHFGDYAAAAGKAAPARGFARRSDIQAGHLVVSEVQHMGLFSGQACLRNLVPEGVDAHALR